MLRGMIEPAGADDESGGTSAERPSIRRRLLFRRERRRDGEVAELGVDLLRVEPAERARPVLRGELEIPLARPVRQDADDVAEVRLGVEPVQLARGDQGEEVRGGGRVDVGPEEQPVAPTDGDVPKRALGVVVRQPEPAVVEEPPERLFVPNGVAEGRGDEAASGLQPLVLAPRPREEVVDDRPRGELPSLVPTLRREIGPLAFELEELVDPEEGLARGGMLRGSRRLPEATPAVTPAADLLGS